LGASSVCWSAVDRGSDNGEHPLREHHLNAAASQTLRRPSLQVIYERKEKCVSRA
jgi:hypothetical protein